MQIFKHQFGIYPGVSNYSESNKTICEVIGSIVEFLGLHKSKMVVQFVKISQKASRRLNRCKLKHQLGGFPRVVYYRESYKITLWMIEAILDYLHAPQIQNGLKIWKKNYIWTVLTLEPMEIQTQTWGLV